MGDNSLSDMGRFQWGNITLVAVGTLMLIIGFTWLLQDSYSQWAAQPPQPHLTAGECFARLNPERWDLPVEGQVFEVGTSHYLILFVGDLKRNHWQEQYASSVAISEFEHTFQRVACPKRWS